MFFQTLTHLCKPDVPPELRTKIASWMEQQPHGYCKYKFQPEFIHGLILNKIRRLQKPLSVYAANY
jgi:hypothetical protein